MTRPSPSSSTTTSRTSPAIAHRRRRSLFVASSASSASAPPTSSDPFARFAEAQAALPRPSLAEEARTLLASAKTGVLSTAAAAAGGHPSGSVVQFALLADPGSGSCSPVLALSSLSAHTRDLAADPRCSLTVLSPGFAGMEDGRVSMACVARKLSEGQEEQKAARAAYRLKHPDAFWADFGDFSWWRLDPVEGKADPPSARIVMGFGRAGSASLSQLAAAAPDPVSGFSGPVAGHMNADHGDAVLAMARSATGLGDKIARAAMGRVDRLGFEVELVLASESGGGSEAAAGGGGERPSSPPSARGGDSGEHLRARVAFPEPAENRKALKDRLVEMTMAAKEASG